MRRSHTLLIVEVQAKVNVDVVHLCIRIAGGGRLGQGRGKGQTEVRGRETASRMPAWLCSGPKETEVGLRGGLGEGEREPEQAVRCERGFVDLAP